MWSGESGVFDAPDLCLRLAFGSLLLLFSLPFGAHNRFLWPPFAAIH